jgi:signal transduction histidine kinase
LFLALAITDFNLLGNYKIPTSSFGRKNFIINATITALMISFFIEFMQRANRKSEKLLLKLTDELNVKKDDLEKTNKELDRFVYSASHDLRAPLASIQGLANIAAVETDLNRNKEYISMIGDRARKLDFFIQEIIDYSRNARTELHLELTDIKALSLEVIENLRFFDHAEEVKFFIDENQLDSTMLDKSRMKIVLNNILSNAIKYHNPKIQHKEVNLKIHHEDKVCVVTIADNGLGIQSEFLDKIFDMFYRATDKSTGSGLGLYIVKEIIIKMGGTIDVQSQFEKGTTFTIKLPIR